MLHRLMLVMLLTSTFGCNAWVRAAPALAATHRTIALNETATPGGPEEAALRVFKRNVEAATHGRLQIAIHLSGELGNAQTSVQNMMFGDLDMYTGNLLDYLPLMIDEVVGLATPFLVDGVEATHRYLASPLLDEAREKVLHNRHVRFLQMAAIRRPFHLVSSKRPLIVPGDWDGLKLTSDKPLTKTAARLWATLGVTYVPLAGSDVKVSMASGRVDAVLLTSLGAIDSLGIGGLAPYIAGIDDCPQVWQISINDTVWLSLTDHERAALQAAAANSADVYDGMAAGAFRRRLAVMTSGSRATTYHDLEARPLRLKMSATYELMTGDGGLSPRVLETANTAVGSTQP